MTRTDDSPRRARSERTKVIWQAGTRACIGAAWLITACAVTASGQTGTGPTPAPASTEMAAVASALPPDYVIGADDVLSIQFWRDRDMSTEVTVRPDGKVSLPLLNEVHAAGLTPDQLRVVVMEAAKKYVEDPNATVVVKTINSRKVYITGQVERPGSFPLNGPTTVLQLIAMAGGLREFVDGKKISVMRIEDGKTVAYRFNYQDILKQKNLKSNILLKPGDTVVVP